MTPGYDPDPGRQPGAHRSPPLAGAISVVLPSEEQTLLLRAALLDGERAAAALLEWQSGTADPVAALARHPGGGRLLAPILCHNLERHRSAIRAELLTYLRTAAVREEVRTRAYRQICGDVLCAMAREAIDPIALKGAALAETVYPKPWLRHSRDIDLLVRREDFLRAASLLSGLGFRVDGTGGPPNGPLGHQVHESGLPLVLHTGLFFFRHYNGSQSAVWQRAERRDICGTPTRVQSPSDHLLHILAHASTGWHREHLLWVCDAWYLLECSQELDWGVFAERARQTNTALPLYVTLGYLQRELGAEVPGDVVEQLGNAARAQGRLARELALFGAWAGPGSKLRRAFQRTRSWRERLFVLRWRLLPSPSTVLSLGRVRSKWKLPAYYLWRPVSALARRARSALYRPQQLTDFGRPSRSPDAELGQVGVRGSGHRRPQVLE